jgi:hypothetical protein
MLRSHKISSGNNFLSKVMLVFILLSFSKSWGQTIIWGPYSGGSVPAGWTFSNNVVANAINQGSYWLVDAGATSDKITSASYDLCAYGSATVCLQVATFGSGGNNPAKIEVSYNGGTTYTDVFTSTTPTSSSYNSQECFNLSQVTASVVIRISNNGTSGRGVRIKNYSLSASGSGGCAPACSAPTTTITPTTQTICNGATTTISISSSATSPSYTWQASSNGTSGWANVVNGTPSGASYSGINTSVLTVTAGSTYYYQCLVAEGGTCTATSSTSTLVVNSISITSQPISVSTTSTGIASYSVTAVGSGLTYQWQQNSGSGFSSISNGGTNPTYAGATSSVLTISNPPLSMSGYSYQCIVSNACGTLTTNASSTITVTSALTCPYLVSAVINSCDGCASEGNNEFLVLNSGSYSFVVNSTNVNITYSNGPTNITSSFAAQPASLATLNTATINACGTTFVDVSNGATTVPPNSTLLIVNKGACFTGDWSDYCGLGTVYVAFSATAAWTTTGFFGNNTTPRSFVTNFSAVNSGCGNTTYAYNQSGIAGTPFNFGSDGASVSFIGGGSAPTYINGNGNCAPPSIILPIELIDFYATQDGNKNDLIWKVASEKNVLKYIIEKSEDGVNFIEMSRVNSYDNEALVITYMTEDTEPYSGITYYRLNTIESNGKTNNYKIIDIDRANKNWKSLLYQIDNNLIIEFKNAIPKEAQVMLFDLSGQQIAERNIEQSQTKINIDNLSTGIYFVRITSPYKIENFKIIIQK